MLIEKSNKMNASLKECHSFWTAMFQDNGIPLGTGEESVE
jgi:hypothetical protein